MKLSNLATDKNRWWALVFLALGLSIVIIDNTVLNVAIPYILRDLNTSFDSIQWVISGYALIIATILITVGRLGDMFGRRRVFVIGAALFATGSFIASLSPNALTLFIGEALIEAVGAAMMMTSSLSLLVSEFHGRERAIAFGVWGSVAGASASIGPLLGGFLTTYYSWRWSLRINVVVALIAILGSIVVKESKGEYSKEFDFWGMIFSGLGLFSLIFGFIEGGKYGWLTPNQPFIVGSFTWPLNFISIIPFTFAFSILMLDIFFVIESLLEQKGKSPLLRLSLFTHSSFSLGLGTLAILSLGQFGIFFVMPIYLQNVLGLSALQTGFVFLTSSIFMAIFGPLSGFASSKIGPKWITSTGMFILALGVLLLRSALSVDATGLTLAPALAVFGIGAGMSSAQLTNIVLSGVPAIFAGEASAVNSTIRQIGTSIGIAILGVVLSSSITSNLTQNISSDNYIPQVSKPAIVNALQNTSVESGQLSSLNFPSLISSAVKRDVNQSVVDGAKVTITYAFFFILLGAVSSLFLPNIQHAPNTQEVKVEEEIEKTP